MKNKSYGDYVFPAFPWALDFTREVYAFGWFRKFLLKILLGKKGFRELIGLSTALHCQTFHDITYGGLGDVDYYKEKVTWESPFIEYEQLQNEKELQKDASDL